MEVVNHEQNAMKELAEQVYALKPLVRRIVGDRDGTEDALEDIVLGICKLFKRGRIVPGENVRLRQLVVLKARDFRQNRWKHQQDWAEVAGKLQNGFAAALSDGPTDPAVAAEEKEQMELCRAQLADLPSNQRAAVMGWLGGRPFSEIAKEAAEPAGTVRSRWHLGRQKLRRGLSS